MSTGGAETGEILPFRCYRLTQTIAGGLHGDIATTRRYLLPLVLNTTRFSPTMLAFALTRLISADERQSAFRASWYHARKGCSEPGGERGGLAAFERPRLGAHCVEPICSMS